MPVVSTPTSFPFMARRPLLEFEKPLVELEEQAVEVVARVLVPMELPPRTVSGRQLRLEEVMAGRVPLPAP